MRSDLVTVVPDEHSSESCEIGSLVQERVERQGKVDIVELQDGGTWYYVVDCATCNALIPFKYAPEDEPVLCFPTMTVRCFHCHAAHTYAPGLISHRKAVPPREILQRDRLSSAGDDGDQEASGDRQEDRAVEGSEGGVIVEREICFSSSSRRVDILIAAVSGKIATIFFWSSCFFAIGWVLQLSLHIFHAARSSGPAVLLTIGYFGSIMFGLLLFTFGIVSLFAEVSRHRAIRSAGRLTRDRPRARQPPGVDLGRRADRQPGQFARAAGHGDISPPRGLRGRIHLRGDARLALRGSVRPAD